MGTATQQVRAKSAGEIYSAHIVRSAETYELAAQAQSLLKARESTSSPAFFLASASQNGWIPQIVAVMQKDKLVGLLYAKEKKLGSVPTGLLYVDTTLGSMPVANELEREAIFQAAVKAVLKQPGVRGLRLVVPHSAFEMSALRSLSATMPLDVCYTRCENHSVLRLPDNYEAFLQSLGPQTRRNFRYYRRRSEAANHCFVENLSIKEFASAAWSLQSETLIKSESEGIQRALHMMTVVEHPLLVGLRSQDGEWLSILGGWYESNRAVVFIQMNSDKRHGNASLSVVLRAYLIETLILRGRRNIVFWAGSGGPLSRYTDYLPCVAVHVDKRTFLWHVFRRAVAPLTGLLPNRFASMAEWVVPRTRQAFPSDAPP